ADPARGAAESPRTRRSRAPAARRRHPGSDRDASGDAAAASTAVGPPRARRGTHAPARPVRLALARHSREGSRSQQANAGEALRARNGPVIRPLAAADASPARGPPARGGTAGARRRSRRGLREPERLHRDVQGGARMHAGPVLRVMTDLLDPRSRRWYGRARMERPIGALAGIRVLDFSHQAAGPWCTSLL